MPDLSDDDVTRTFDYLGRRQPLAPERVGLATGAGGPSSAGGAVTAGSMPSVGQRVQALRGLATPGPNEAQQIISGISTAKSFAEKVAGVRDLFPTEIRRGETGRVSLSDQLRSSAPTEGSPALIDASRDFLGSAAGPTSFGDVDPLLVAQINSPGIDVGAAGFEAAEGANSAASAGAAGSEGASGLAGSAAGALPLLGTALQLAQTIASDETDARKAANATLIAASVFSMGAFKAIDEISGALGGPQLGDLFEDVFGGPTLNHEQREALDLQKHVGPGAVEFQQAIRKAKTPDDLWRTLVSHGSGYTGGHSPVAVRISLPESGEHLRAAVAAGEVALPTRYGNDVERFLADHEGATVPVGPGEANAYYPVFTEAGFYKALAADPRGLRAGVQAGVAQDKLSPMNAALANTILQQFGRIIPGDAAPPPPEMPTAGVDPGGPKNPAVNPPGPSAALGFSQDLMRDAAA